MALHYDNPDPLESESLRTQRMTADEAASVIALWQQERVEQTGLTDRPAVPDVAEGLDIPVEEVQRLLAEVRARRVEEERALAQEQAQISLSQEEGRLAAVRLQRAERRRVQMYRQKQTEPRHKWVETRPGIWEDVNEPTSGLSAGAKAGVIIICLVLSTLISVLGCIIWIISSAAHN